MDLSPKMLKNFDLSREIVLFGCLDSNPNPPLPISASYPSYPSYPYIVYLGRFRPPLEPKNNLKKTLESYIFSSIVLCS